MIKTYRLSINTFLFIICINIINHSLAKDWNWQSKSLSKYFEGNPKNESVPQDVQSEPSTFHSIGVRWPIVGDANANAKILVRYKRSSDTEYFPGLKISEFVFSLE